MTDASLPPTGSSPVPPPPARPEPPRDLLTPRMLDAFRTIRPWAQFLAIVGFVTAALQSLGAVVMVGSALTLSARHQKGAAMNLGIAALYLLMAAIGFFPSRYVYRYAKSIQRALASRSKSAAIEEALAHEKSLWRFLGIGTVAMVAINVPLVIAVLLIPPILSSGQREKQRQTVIDMKKIVSALAAYEEAEYKYPNADNIHALANSLEGKYIGALPRTDGWKKQFVYSGSDCTSLGCRSYLLYSGGRNGELEEQPPFDPTAPRATKGWEGDIVVRNGAFLRKPEGINF